METVRAASRIADKGRTVTGIRFKTVKTVGRIGGIEIVEKIGTVIGTVRKVRIGVALCRMLPRGRPSGSLYQGNGIEIETEQGIRTVRAVETTRQTTGGRTVDPGTHLTVRGLRALTIFAEFVALEKTSTRKDGVKRKDKAIEELMVGNREGRRIEMKTNEINVLHHRILLSAPESVMYSVSWGMESLSFILLISTICCEECGEQRLNQTLSLGPLRRLVGRADPLVA